MAKLLKNEVEAIERTIRKFVKKDGGFRKGITLKSQKHARKLLHKLGRRTVTWDSSINFNMVATKSKVRPKTHKNSID